MAENPSGFVNWADYLGANQEAADQQSQQLLGATDKGAADLSKFRSGFLGHATEAGLNGEADPYQGRQEDYQQAELSYGAAVEQLRDPATRQAVMQKQFGGASALDSALVGAGKGFASGLDERTKAEATNRATSEGMIDQRFTDAQKGKATSDAWNANDKAQRQGMYDRWLASKQQTAQNDKNRSIDAYARSKNGGEYDPNGKLELRDSYNPFGGGHEQTQRDYWGQKYDELKSYRPNDRYGTTANGAWTVNGQEQNGSS